MNVQFSRRWKVFGGGVLLAVGCHAGSSEIEKLNYPFELTEEVTASISVNTNTLTPINNQLLGLNANWPENLYGKIGYNHPDAQKLVRVFNPSFLRFPHGVWANFYDWESDGRRKTDNYVTPYDGSVTNHPTLKYGFDGFHQLHEELKFDTVFTYNLNYDSPEKGARRLKDRKAKGFDVRWVELGNEPFWKTQRSEATKTVADYISVSREYTAALKAVDPNLKVSVPVHWRDAVSNPWNQPFLTEDYFDAITVHKHMGGSPETTLYTGQVLSDMADTFRELFPNHPIWLTEWSTGKGENAISVLGMVDGYLTLFENQDIFDMACFFQMNASHPLFEYDKRSGRHAKTSFGAAYEMVRDLFEDAHLLETRMQTVQLAEGKDAVRSVAVMKNGKMCLFVINKATKPSLLEVQVNDRSMKQTPVLYSLFFKDVNETKRLAVDESPCIEMPLHDGQIILPPLSINRIEL